MCDYSLQHVSSRPARIGDKLSTRDFGSGTRGFSAAEDADLVVCVLPGTELAFAADVTCTATGLFPWRPRRMRQRTAIFRQIDTKRAAAHHDALEFPDGRIVLLTRLREGQTATILQLPATPNSAATAARRVSYSG